MASGALHQSIPVDLIRAIAALMRTARILMHTRAHDGELGGWQTFGAYAIVCWKVMRYLGAVTLKPRNALISL